MAKLAPRANFWLENEEGEVVLSPWRIRLLEEVAATGSISGAARAMDIPYRLAWQRIREMEERLGMELVVAHTGGTRGGGASLTPEAEDVIERFRRFLQGLEEVVEEHFRESFSE
jgi:molybdate transport system regulatory protein